MERFDYIVVGAGSAGCVLAARLTEDRTARVLLLEAGPRDNDPAVHVPAAFPRLFGTRRDWNLHTAPQPALGGRRVYWPRGRMLGGSSSMNAMMWVRGLASDYDLWAKSCGSEWSFEAVLAAFRRIEDTAGAHRDDPLYGVGGPVALAELRSTNPLTLAWLAAARNCGIGTIAARNAGDDEGVATPFVNQRGGRRQSAADAYLRPAEHRPNLVVRTGTTVEQITVAHGVATGVSFRSGRELAVAQAAREVLLCAGSIGSPELLMRSGIGPAAMLRTAGVAPVADVPGIGQHLEDHLCAGFAIGVDSRASLGGALGPGAVLSYLLARRGLLTSNICEGYGFVRSGPLVETCDLELVFVPALFLDEGRTITRRHGITLAAVLLSPESRGELRLEAGRSSPRLVIDPRYLTDAAGHDAAVLASGVRRCLEIAKTPPLNLITTELVQPPPGTDDEVVERAVHDFAQTLYHPVGTCRMGSDLDSVVDPELRLRALQGLRVADASVIPRIIHGHTNAPTLLIAERAAQLVQAER